jgi:hypothetical protein
MKVTTTYKIKDVSEGKDSEKYLSGKHPNFRFTKIGRVFVQEKDVRRHAKMFVTHWRNVGKGDEPMNWIVERYTGEKVESMPIETFFDNGGFSAT